MTSVRARTDGLSAVHWAEAWAQAWRPILASLPVGTDQLANLAAWYDDPSLGQAITAHARTLAENAHPDHAPAQAGAQALNAYEKARTSYPAQLAGHRDLAWLPDPGGALARSQREVAELTDQLQAARGRVRAALAEPAIRSLPQERIETERERWATEPQQHQQEERTASDGPDVPPSPTSWRQHERSAPSYAPKPGRGIGR